MKDINHYTTLSEQAVKEIESLNKNQRLAVIENIASWLRGFGYAYTDIFCPEVEEEISTLNQNQALGLIKSLCDRCQETLISK